MIMGFDDPHCKISNRSDGYGSWGRGVMEEATIFHTTAVHAQPTKNAMKNNEAVFGR